MPRVDLPPTPVGPDAWSRPPSAPRLATFKRIAQAADAGSRGLTEMPAPPSIKGSLLSSIIESILKLVSAGQISRDELERGLEPGDFQVLDSKIQLTQWYDIRCYERLVKLLLDVEGGGQNEYLRQRGEQAAERLLKAGLYQQMEYLSRMQAEKVTDPKERFLAYGRDLRLLTTLSANLVNFSRWEARPDPEWPDRYRIEISEATDYPEVLAWQTDGLINRMATQHRAEPLALGARAPRSHCLPNDSVTLSDRVSHPSHSEWLLALGPTQGRVSKGSSAERASRAGSYGSGDTLRPARPCSR